MSAGKKTAGNTQHAPLTGSGLRILLTDTKRWATGPRVGMAFADLGCTVGMVCAPQGHPAYTLSSIPHRFVYRGLTPLSSLSAAIREFDPHLVIPVCDRSLSHLHRLYEHAKQHGDSRLMEVIERSLGPAASYPIVTSRHTHMSLAQSEAICTAETVALGNEDDARRAAELGMPLVLKVDGSWGGVGVKVAQHPEEVVQHYRKFSRSRGAVRLIKELALNRDRGNTFDDWKNCRPSVIAQRWVNGFPANCAVACSEGKMLAGVAVEVELTRGDRGPACLVKVVEGREMLDAAERIARRLHLSGFFGLDFMIERETRKPFMIEMNPRCTQAAMLTLGLGRNLPAAMAACLAGKPEPDTTPLTDLERIAFFPKPESIPDPDLTRPEWSYYYDLPQNEPAFVRRMLNQWRDRGILGRGLDRARKIAAHRLSGPWAVRNDEVNTSNPR